MCENCTHSLPKVEGIFILNELTRHIKYKALRLLIDSHSQLVLLPCTSGTAPYTHSLMYLNLHYPQLRFTSVLLIPCILRDLYRTLTYSFLTIKDVLTVKLTNHIQKSGRVQDLHLYYALCTLHFKVVILLWVNLCTTVSPG